MPTTTDERYGSRLEAELAAAHERIGELNEALARETAARDSALGRVAEFQPLAESAIALRQEVESVKRERDGFATYKASVRARIRGLEETLSEREARIGRLEAELDRYRRANERVQRASHILDLLDQEQ